MEPLANGYLSDIAQQIGATSAFLGGFAATMLATLLALQAKGRAASWSIAASAVAAVAFIASVMGSIKLVALTHPLAPASVSGAISGVGRTLGFLPFVVGLFALLLSVGASGFLRSKRMGWGTSLLAALGALMVVWAITL